jgi:uncharacterized protein (TIGR02246 family)
MTDDEPAIREVVETWVRASRSGDTATVLSLMTKDAVFMVPGREPFGREVFEVALRRSTEATKSWRFRCSVTGPSPATASI